MYATYTYSAGITQANLLADLVALLTGTTDKALLSAGCDQANTSIIATDPAGWTVFDAAAGANKQCLRALQQDGTTYTYALPEINTTAQFKIGLAEAWNAGAHTGTNVLVPTAVVWSQASGGKLYVYATSKNIFVRSWIPSTFQSVVSSWITEASRDFIPAAYPAAFMCRGADNLGGPTASFSSPRRKALTSAGDNTLNSTIYAGPIMPVTGNSSLSSATLVRDATEALTCPMYRLGISDGTVSSVAQTYLGTVYDIYVAPFSAASQSDTIDYGGTTYVFEKLSLASLLIPRR